MTTSSYACPDVRWGKEEIQMADGLRKGLTSYGDAGFSLFLRKAFIKAMGYSDDALNRPIVGITNTHSDYNPCHGNVPEIIEAVKRGVMLAGAMPMVFPTISIAESFAFPTSMYLRNLMAMDTEEMIRAQPMDSVVVIGGCDNSGAACRALSFRGSQRQGGRRDGEGKGAEAERVPHPGRVPQRAGGAAGDRWLDQRPHSSHRDRKP